MDSVEVLHIETRNDLIGAVWGYDGHTLSVDDRGDEGKFFVIDGKPIRLTKYEYETFELVVKGAGTFVTTDMLCAGLYGSKRYSDQHKIVKVFICHIRRKLGPCKHLLGTVKGRGYLWQGRFPYDSDKTNDSSEMSAHTDKPRHFRYRGRSSKVLPHPKLSSWRGVHRFRVVRAVEEGHVTLEEVLGRYQMSIEEYAAWEDEYRKHYKLR